MPPVIDKTKCISCTTCAQICPLDVYGPVVKGQIPEVLYPNECWHCRACEFDCPVGAISRETPNLTSGDKCINCMRCIQVCPRKARSMPARFLEGAKTMLEKNAAKRREAELFL